MPAKLLRGGWIVDGTGAPPFRGDVAVEGDRIAAVGHLGDYHGRADEVVDIAGLFVMPGFIDAHVHGDLMLMADPIQRPASWHSIVRAISTSQQ